MLMYHGGGPRRRVGSLSVTYASCLTATVPQAVIIARKNSNRRGAAAWRRREIAPRLVAMGTTAMLMPEWREMHEDPPCSVAQSRAARTWATGCSTPGPRPATPVSVTVVRRISSGVRIEGSLTDQTDPSLSFRACPLPTTVSIRRIGDGVVTSASMVAGGDDDCLAASYNAPQRRLTCGCP
jgi:hypothetical protein